MLSCDPDQRDVSSKARLLAIASILAWAAAITSGRLLAYTVAGGCRRSPRSTSPRAPDDAERIVAAAAGRIHVRFGRPIRPEEWATVHGQKARCLYVIGELEQRIGDLARGH